MKLVALEAETLALRAFLSDEGARVASSVVAAVEVPRAARRYGREGEAARVLERVEQIRLEPEIVELAGQIEPVALGSLDAIHLASALFLADDLDAFVVYDRRLAAVAAGAGLSVAAPGEEA